MISNDEKQKIIVLICLSSLLLLGIPSQIYFSFNLPLDSDQTVPFLLFQDIVKDNNWFLANWYFPSNSYLFSDLPFYLFFGSIFGNNIFSIHLSKTFIYLFTAFLLICIIYKTFGGKASLLAAACIFTFPLDVARLLLISFSHIGTIGASFLCVLLVISIIRYQESSKFKSFILLIMSVLTVFSDPYFIAIFIIPMCSVLLLSKILNRNFITGKTVVILMTVLISATAMGLYFQGLARAVGLYIYASDMIYLPDAVSLKEIMSKMQDYYYSVTALFNINLIEGDLNLFSALIKTANLLLFLLTGISVMFYLKKEKDSLKRFTAFFFINVIIVLSVAVFLKRGYFAARYITPIFYIFAVFLSVAIEKNHFELKRKMGFVLIILFFMSSSYNLYKGFPYKEKQPHVDLAKLLISEDLKYGYSFYTYSNIISALTGNTVKVRHVIFNDLLPFSPGVRPLEMDPLNSKSDWYKPSLHKGPTFLLVPKKDSTRKSFLIYRDPGVVQQLFGKPKKIINHEDAVIYVWPYNIMNLSLPTVELSDRTPHEVGKFMGNMMYAGKGAEGYLIHHTLWTLKPEKYRAKFVIITTGEPGQKTAEIDVNKYDESTRESIASVKKEVFADSGKQWKEYNIDFDVPGSKNNSISYEFRVYSTGKGEVSVSRIALE